MNFKKTALFSSALAILVIASLIGSPFAHDVEATQIGTVTGWAWAYMPDANDQNDTTWQNANHQGNVGTGIGWIAFSNTDYGGTVAHSVTIDNNGYLHGYAWSEYVGYIQFDPAGPYPSVQPQSNLPGPSTQMPTPPGNPGTTVQQGPTGSLSPAGSGIGQSGATLNNNNPTPSKPPSTPVPPVLNGSGGTGTSNVNQQSGWLPKALQDIFGTKVAYAQSLGSAHIDLQTGEWSGWARVVTATSSTANQLGGWDGWIALRGNGFGVMTNLSGGCTVDCSTVGHAWGDMVMGWIAFANVKVNLEIDMCVNMPGNQSTVPSNAVQLTGNLCDFCSNISGAQAAVPSGFTQFPWPNGSGFNCIKTTTLDPSSACKLNPALCPHNLCPNIPPVPAGTTYGDWTSVPGQIIDSGTNYCILSSEVCMDPAALNYGGSLPCKYEPSCDPSDPDCPVTGGKPIYEET